MEEASDKAKDSFAVLWQDPLDLEGRDLFHGIGGREGAPDPDAKYTFVSDKGSPNDSNPKILIKDEEGRSWTVKFGPEVKSETAATRLAWAAGYHPDQDYFVERATIEGFTRLETRNMRFERKPGVRGRNISLMAWNHPSWSRAVVSRVANSSPPKTC